MAPIGDPVSIMKGSGQCRFHDFSQSRERPRYSALALCTKTRSLASPLLPATAGSGRALQLAGLLHTSRIGRGGTAALPHSVMGDDDKCIPVETLGYTQ